MSLNYKANKYYWKSRNFLLFSGNFLAKQKEYYNKKFKRKARFEIGEQVLLYDAAKEKQWNGKLKEKGPYYIHDTIRNGAYKIKELDRRILKTPINGELLKNYIFSKKNNWFSEKVIGLNIIDYYDIHCRTTPSLLETHYISKCYYEQNELWKQFLIEYSYENRIEILNIHNYDKTSGIKILKIPIIGPLHISLLWAWFL
ncbi:hypothetical protein RhiirC2_790374 [Rhizophagus irregularis]|uniref:Uncharacterized protein n=1 Tax=Rhizophagus irregularis TaxID=588596 RepID=A0A2N1MLC7_9GLOM|nr:hypothetical protein RhiirC2_790374 [Rhizophagus irregularis]